MVADVVHPEYAALADSWEEWRLTFEGGDDFIETYLKKLSIREAPSDFEDRKEITYCPAFAKMAVIEIKNAIYQRMNEIKRHGGPESYKRAVAGDVDRTGNTMSTFIGTEVLPELLPMKKVGVYVDRDYVPEASTLMDVTSDPYLYIYQAEDIRSWKYEGSKLVKLLLRDTGYTYDKLTGLPNGTVETFRLLELAQDGVLVTFYTVDDNGAPKVIGTQTLRLKNIPFAIAELPDSLLRDVSRYQVALLNVESSDISYIQKANFPFYVEQFDPRVELPYLIPPVNPDQNLTEAGTAQPSPTARAPEVHVGLIQGRRYPMGADAPSFINPSSEPLKVSMQKEEQIKQDIRLLVNLAVTNMKPPVMASAESKAADTQSLETGLSYIGLVLEQLENNIAKIWADYEGAEPAVIQYPKNYSLKTEDERLKEADRKIELMEKIPSNTFKKEMAKDVVDTLLAIRVPEDIITTIKEEIDNAQAIVSDPKILSEDWKNGFVDTDTASKLRGYPEGMAEKAAKDHSERLKRILEAQGGAGGDARGVPEMQGGQPTSGDEKLGMPKRGETRL